MTLFAGAAQRDISPTQPMQLAGYPHVRRISTGVHDPLLAAALFLANGNQSVLLCALDLLELNADVTRRIRRRVAGQLGIPESSVFITCSHTHSAPVTLDYLPFAGDPAMPAPDPAYLQYCEDQIVIAALAARGRAQPAELAWTTADARGVGGNRHSPNGPTDPEVGVLAVRSGGKLLAVTLIYGMHPTVLHEDSTLVSADFPHFARLHLQEALGRDLVVLYHTAPCGNQSPRYFVNGQTFAEAERLGRKLGAAALSSLANLNAGSAELAGTLQTVKLPRRTLPGVADAEKLLADYRAEFVRLQAGGAERAQVRTAECAVFGAEAVVQLARLQATGAVEEIMARLEPFEVQVVRIGEVSLVGFPGEMFVEYALELKRRAPRKTFSTAYTNGELQGYIVTPAAAVAGGYEAASSMFEPHAGRVLIETALKVLARE